MHHAPYRFTGKEIPHTLSIREIELYEAKSLVRRQLGESSLFQSHVVVVVEIVEADHPVATVQKAHGHMKSDKPCCSCDKNRRLCPGHGCSSKKNSLRMLQKSSSVVLASLKASTYQPRTPRPFAQCGLAGRNFSASSEIL